jgi:hypothetical protein
MTPLFTESAEPDRIDVNARTVEPRVVDVELSLGLPAQFTDVAKRDGITNVQDTGQTSVKRFKAIQDWLEEDGVRRNHIALDRANNFQNIAIGIQLPGLPSFDMLVVSASSILVAVGAEFPGGKGLLADLFYLRMALGSLEEQEIDHTLFAIDQRPTRTKLADDGRVFLQCDEVFHAHLLHDETTILEACESAAEPLASLGITFHAFGGKNRA